MKVYVAMDSKLQEEDVRRRIKLLMDELMFNENKLAAGDSPTQKRLNRQLSHGAAITLDTILLILNTFADISPEWLLKGKGDMYVGSYNVVCEPATYYKASPKKEKTSQQASVLSEEFVRDLLAVKDKQIDELLKLLDKR